jgi:acyl-[acyl-carrier-protein]-phospholipid O-acyltransferase / long-chain-fatty-acid--[acyl-carrier-protein] ligase
VADALASLRPFIDVPLFADLMDEPWPVVAAVLVGLAVLVLALWRWPMAFVRAFLWVLTHTAYRQRIVGLENVPKTGGALLVCNHISFIDWLLVLAAQPRFIRFLIYAPYANIWGFRHLMRWARVIPIDGSGGPRATLKALHAASDALTAGELVCVFAEGTMSRTGFLLPFHRGFQQILKRSPAPVVPVCLDQVWGSVFSFAGGKLFWKLPRHFPYPVGVSFGTPMPATSSAAEVRLAIQWLSAEWAVRRSDELMPVHRRFVRMAARHPFRPCVFDPLRPEGITYGRTLAGAMCFARWLRPVLGNEPMVGVWLPPGAGGVLGNAAVALLGKTPVNLNYTAGTDNVQCAIRQCGIKHVLTARRFTARVKVDPGPGVELIYVEDVAGQISKGQRLRAFLAVVLLPGLILERLLGVHRHGLDDVATVIFSSGSTGEPKGVVLTHRNIAANAVSVIQAVQIGPADRLLGILPFFHSFGYTVTLWTALQMGASLVYFPDPRAAKDIGELCKKYRCTLFVSTATFLRFCLKRCQTDEFTTLRLLICGAEKLPPALAGEFEEKFQVRPLEGYGCTELSPVVSTSLPDRVIEGVRYVLNKSGSIGQPIPGVAVKVVNPDDYAEELPPGQEGLLLVHGANVMKGYLGRDDLTRKVVLDGTWYVTGDMARIDEDGFIFLTGRLSRFAKIGGEMVPLEKVEEELQTLVGSSERVLAVTCVPDEARGERLVVLYVSLSGQEPRGLARGLSGRGLPNLWVPGERDFYLVHDLPILGSGKLDLKRVKEMAQEVVGGGGLTGPHACREAVRPSPAAP